MDSKFEQRITEQIADEFARTEAPAGFPHLNDLPLGRYTDPAMFELEQSRVFRGTWLFAAHESEIPEPGDYRTFDLAGIPVLLVRSETGRVNAFVNACRHRSAPVVRDECGSCRLLVCQYHSWSYDLDGNLVRVPDERDFVGLDPAVRGLVAIRCEAWGRFIFVCANEDARPLIEWLGPLADELRHVVEAPLRVVQRTHSDVRCNWKIMAEGFLEVSGAPADHPVPADFPQARYLKCVLCRVS